MTRSAVAGEHDVTLTEADELPAQRGGAKAFLLTVLGEFVLPGGGGVWTSTLVAAAEALGIGEKNARQAIARIGEQGLISSSRHGRQVRWTLTPAGRDLLETGTSRIYEFGTPDTEWSGRWLVAHCQVAESRRAVRTRLRTQLAFLGFGELSASLLISPHVEREPELRRVLERLDLMDDSIVMRSTMATADENADLVARAWDLGALAEEYSAFVCAAQERAAVTDAEQFPALVELVHDWRRFPFVDPELPPELLPQPWAGDTAATVFRERHAAWSSGARRRFGALEAHDAARA